MDSVLVRVYKYNEDSGEDKEFEVKDEIERRAQGMILKMKLLMEDSFLVCGRYEDEPEKKEILKGYGGEGTKQSKAEVLTDVINELYTRRTGKR